MWVWMGVGVDGVWGRGVEGCTVGVDGCGVGVWMSVGRGVDECG